MHQVALLVKEAKRVQRARQNSDALRVAEAELPRDEMVHEGENTHRHVFHHQTVVPPDEAHDVLARLQRPQHFVFGVQHAEVGAVGLVVVACVVFEFGGC